MKLPLLGFDPSLSNWGYSSVWYDADSGLIEIDEIGVISPEKISAKTVRQNSKDIYRAIQLGDKAYKLIQEKEPIAVFVEVPVGSQSARAMASYGVCVGIHATLQAVCDVTFYEVTPTEVKLSTVGKKTASKKEMIDWATALYPKAKWPTYNRNGEVKIVESTAEHIADSLGAIHAGLQQRSAFSDYLRTVRHKSLER